MTDNNQIRNDVESYQSSVKIGEEWTIIHGASPEKESSDDSIEYIERITDAREATEDLDELTMSDDNNKDKLDAETSGVAIEEQCEDSDGISVITESEPEHYLTEKKFVQFDRCKDHLCSTLQKYEKPAPQVGAVLNVIIACSLAAIIGLGAGRIFQMDDNCHVSNSIDFATVKMESDKLINLMKELNEVKDVLDELRTTIPQVKRSAKMSAQRRSKSSPKGPDRVEKRSQMSDRYIFHPDTGILEQLETSLNTLCAVIDEMSPYQRDFASTDASETQNIVADLIEFQKVMNDVITELGDAERPNQLAFLRNAEMRIIEVSRSVLNDLTYTVRNLTNKIHRKLNKVRHKLNKRLCLMKNSELIDAGIFESLRENNSFLESCEKILNLSMKPRVGSDAANAGETLRRKTYTRTKRALGANSAEKSASDDDGYSRYSSSDSSMRNFSYKRNEKLKNDVKRRRTKESSDSSRAPSLESLMMGVVVPENICSVDEEVQIPQPTLRPKPLYSTILKAAPGPDKLNDSRDSDFHNQGKENSMRVEPIGAKAQGNTAVKKCARSEERSFETRGDPERSESIFETSPPSIDVIYCKKGKKCYDDTGATSGSRKKHKKKDAKKKTNNDGDDGNKKSRRGKRERKSAPLVGENSEKLKRDYKKKDENLKLDEQLPGDWQTQRSRSREVNRDRNDRMGWFFDRADSRQKARKNGDAVKIPDYHRSKVYSQVFGERSDDEELLDEWLESKEMNSRKHGGDRGAFRAKKFLKMPHRKNILQSKYR